MSYGIKLNVTNGTVTVASQSGTVPDGTIQVNGHDDAQSRNISVSHEAGGNQAVSASGFARRAG